MEPRPGGLFLSHNVATLVNNNLGRKQHAEVTLNNGEYVTVMTNVIWMLSWLLQVLTAMSVLPKPNNLTLTSKKFIHLVTWKPGPDTPPDTYYNVSVHSGWGDWVLVCERVRSPLLCNLTEHFPDHKKVYYTQIEAGLGSNVSEPLQHPGFVPLKETEMEQPLLTVAPCGLRSLCVDLQPPEERLRDIYQTLHYRLKVQTTADHNSRSQPATFDQKTEGLKGHNLTDLASGRQYCVFVSFVDEYLDRKSNYSSQPVCAFTTALPPGSAIEIVAPSLLCALVVCIIVGLVLLWWTGFLCLKTVLPSNLMDITNNPKEEQFHPKEAQFVLDGIISLILVESALPSTGGKGNNNRQSEEGHDDDDDDGETKQESPSGSGGDGYTSRRGPLSPSPCSSSSFSSSSPTGRSSSFEPVSSDQHTVLLLELSNGVRDHTHSSHLRPTSPLRSQPTDLQPAVGTDRHAPAVLSTVPLPESKVRGSSGACEMMLQPHVEGLDALTAGVVKTKVEEVAIKGSGQGVNLWSLTFGGHEPEEVNRDTAPPPSDGEGKAPDDASAPLLPPSREVTDTMEEVAVETVAAIEEEEEEDEECSGYMKR